jgi:2-haloacid dehalogenase
MTNGSISITKGLLEKAHVEQYVDEMMDITQPKAWKPSPAAYHFAVKQLI